VRSVGIILRSYYNVDPSSSLNITGNNPTTSINGSLVLGFGINSYGADCGTSCTITIDSVTNSNSNSSVDTYIRSCYGCTTIGGLQVGDSGVVALAQSLTFSGQVTALQVNGGTSSNSASLTYSTIVLNPATTLVPGLVRALATKLKLNVGDTDKTNVVGFVTNNMVKGSYTQVQTSGTVSGFSGLTPGAVYYLSNTGAISTATGDTTIKVGTALSSTQLSYSR